jgi:hypothetical protein
MWTKEKTKHVDKVIRSAAFARDKDDLGDALCQVEDDTGYEYSFIYEIFCETIADEDLTREEANDPEILLPIWDSVITPAYEYDY